MAVSSSQCRCAVYTRQSRESNSDYSSCDAQYDACLHFILAHASQGWTPVDRRYDDEGYSGEREYRPGLNRLKFDINAGLIDRVVVQRLDRLSRKVMHCTTLLDLFRQQGIAILIVTTPELGTSASDGLLLNLFSVFAEFERDLIRERLSETRTALKNRGRRVAGAIPFGYTTDPVSKQLLPDRSEARRVKAMFERAAKGETPRQIAAHANRRGWRTKSIRFRATGKTNRGQHWTARQILSTLSNPVYLGLIRHGNRTRDGVNQPFVIPELFQQVAQQISDRRTQVKPRRREPSFPWPLGGLLFCGQCGRLMSPSVSGYRNLQYRYYRCHSQAGGRKPCPDVSVPAEEIEQFVCEQQANLKLRSAMTDSTEVAQIHRDFMTTWAGIPFNQQRHMLPKVVDNVVLHMGKGTLRIKIQAGAVEWLIAGHNDS